MKVSLFLDILSLLNYSRVPLDSLIHSILLSTYFNNFSGDACFIGPGFRVISVFGQKVYRSFYSFFFQKESQYYRQPGLLSYVWGNIHQLQITDLPKLQNELVYLERDERNVILATTATILELIFLIASQFGRIICRTELALKNKVTRFDENKSCGMT